MKKIINYRNTALALVLAISGFMAPSLKATEDPKAIAVELQFLGRHAWSLYVWAARGPSSSGA